MQSPHRPFVLPAVVVSLTAFGYFTGIAFVADGASAEPWILLARAVAAVVAGTLFMLRERQREMATTGAAAIDGLVLAVVVIVSNSLFGSDASGRDLAMRTAGLLTGLPGLAVLSHLLARTSSRPTVDG